MDKILSLISIATKAGKVVNGEFATEKAIKDGKAQLVILAEDAGPNTKKHFSDMCSYRDIPCRYYRSMEELGRSCGKDFRSNLAICDKGFSDTIIRLLAEVEI